jgi:hypothetical protein
LAANAMDNKQAAAHEALLMLNRQAVANALAAYLGALMISQIDNLMLNAKLFYICLYAQRWIQWLDLS